MADKVWVPVSNGYEVELAWGQVHKIVWGYNEVMKLDRAREHYAAKRALRPLLDWVEENELGLTPKDMAEIVHWWEREGSYLDAERAAKAVEEATKRR